NFNGPSGAYVTFPTLPPGYTCMPTSGSFFPVGTNTVTCTADGQPACSFNVIVADTCPQTCCPTDIMFTDACPTDTGVQCYKDVPPAPTLHWVDNCGHTDAASFDQQETNPGSSCNNVITRTWTATYLGG